ncbi:conserved hypothetical protein [Alteracholeplasma palmae J233]|uniref:Uncharacterized protein n=1 Tax=Alteracholeplasma palmae (strain ATCC 49389 / J233) TaxID=1318466 RepID=U4KJR2_ALTPJ|nr:hypothetical protein [Alteracholeplasma palmae]CCV63658.1 conserved hypothetical protein [Alteracholeplasma palmae J233]
MSREILIEENKVLKLKNVLVRPITFDDEEGLDKKIYMMENYIKTKGLENVGPLILYTTVVGTENPKLFMKAMMQLKSKHEIPMPPYEYVEEFKVGPCLFARFKGKEESSSIAQNKLQVYAYENGLILDSKSYNVFKEKNENYTVIDTFIPIIGKEDIEFENI